MEKDKSRSSAIEAINTAIRAFEKIEYLDETYSKNLNFLNAKYINKNHYYQIVIFI